MQATLVLDRIERRLSFDDTTARHHRGPEGHLAEEARFIEAQAVAIIAVHAGEDRLGQILVGSMVIGGIDPAAGREQLDRFTDILVWEIRAHLSNIGFIVVNTPTPYVMSDPGVAAVVQRGELCT